MENRIQLNANLRFAASGELISRDLLINFREQNLDDCCQLVADFTKRFNLNLGLVANQLPEPQVKQIPVKFQQEKPEESQMPRCRRCNVEMQRYASKFKPNTYWLGCPNFRFNGCLEKLPA